MGLFVKVEGRILFVENIKAEEHMLMFKNSLRLIQNIKLKKKKNQQKTCFTILHSEANPALRAAGHPVTASCCSGWTAQQRGLGEKEHAQISQDNMCRGWAGIAPCPGL